MSFPVGIHEELLGRMIAGKLELETYIGGGSMGQVYLAKHHALNKLIAIKVMRAEVQPTTEQVARFRAEAQASSRLDHRNSVQILDFGEDGPDQLLYIAMEYLQGEDMNTMLRREGAIDPGRATKIMAQVCAALGAAHDVGIIHRDIKPGNIMLTKKKSDDGVIEEFVKVCDFGIAKLLTKDESDVDPMTLTGVSLGTPAYASPEQIMGEPLDGRSDIYSCGVVLYTALAGKQPFIADSAVAMAMHHIGTEPEPLIKIRPDLNPGLADVVHIALRKKPDERFGTVRDMRAALKVYIADNRDPSTAEYALHTLPPDHPAMTTASAMAHAAVSKAIAAQTLEPVSGPHAPAKADPPIAADEDQPVAAGPDVAPRLTEPPPAATPIAPAPIAPALADDAADDAADLLADFVKNDPPVGIEPVLDESIPIERPTVDPIPQEEDAGSSKRLVVGLAIALLVALSTFAALFLVDSR